MDIEKVKVEIKLSDNKETSSLLAQATIRERYWIIKGFSIWKSSRMNERLQEAIFIKPPQYKDSFGKSRPFVVLDNKKLWYELEHKIYSAYYEARFSANDIPPKEET